MRVMRSILAAGILTALAAAAGCEATPQAQDRTLGGVTPADIELRDALQQLAKFHADRTRLQMYVALPFIRKVDPELRAMSDYAGARNREMLAELQAYAKSRNVDLTFKYGPDIFSQAQNRMDKLQGDNLQASKEEFDGLLLFVIYIDHSFGKSLIETILAQTKNMDPELKTVLQRDLAMHNEVLARVMPMLRRLKFQK